MRRSATRRRTKRVLVPSRSAASSTVSRRTSGAGVDMEFLPRVRADRRWSCGLENGGYRTADLVSEFFTAGVVSGTCHGSGGVGAEGVGRVVAARAGEGEAGDGEG